VTIPDPDDPDHRYHGAVGTVVSVSLDDLGTLTGDPADDYIYTVRFDDAELGEMTFRQPDLTSA
jgi:uncharacterized secreted protein with C-terminal beta-propeller domain